ncbi:MAG: STAS domain-containing protein [Gemmataceae bacterium]|nr:STAS domain-containing protein [Gemmataceae bacterium]
MQLTLISQDSGLARLECEGQITQNDFEPGDDPMVSVLGSEGFSRKVLLNLEKTSYIDSSGISWLVICHKKFLQGGGRLILHTIPPMVNHVLQLLRLNSIMHIAADEASARAMVGGANR